MPTLNILLCTRNGAAYLGRQLQSFVNQTHVDWRLWASDDGSTDDTRALLADFAAAHPDRVAPPVAGPGQGAAAHFLWQLARPEMAGQWVAFADQDDVWLPHKLARAAEWLRPAPPDALYASRSMHTDAAGTVLGPSPRHPRPLGFGNALVQNVLGGNTLVLTPGATDRLRATLDAARRADVPFHDWWVYLVATGTGMPILHDDEPGLLYRQHGGNLLGAGGRRRLARAAMLWDGTYAGWIDRNLAALAQVERLTPEAAVLCDAVRRWRAEGQGSPQALGLYRQSRGGDMALRGLAALGRL
ncbi:glycosyltransferase [Tateyamaria omphalii]|uniref:glycosyltransferase n=1 Tax=Tateyamaria omphalii TaxID=299262 RepID=UPI001C99EC2D|nr:glycosyltransferase [Tateyamaria omphalii]MBY5935557.1 glycosyltransferase [Tateyamaria omphalii]